MFLVYRPFPASKGIFDFRAIFIGCQLFSLLKIILVTKILYEKMRNREYQKPSILSIFIVLLQQFFDARKYV
jgi:hypothetical protein